MDFLTLIVIMAIVYLLPELLKRRKNKEYKYPEIPLNKEAEFPPIPIIQQEEWHKNVPEPTTIQPLVSPPTAYSVDDANSRNAWQGKLNESMVMNGIIFAEILSPPLAKRQTRQLHISNGYKKLK